MGIFDKIWDVTTDVLHGVTGIPTADEKRNAQRMVSDQLNAYKRQTQILEKETARKREQELAEKRRINEKAVRGMRRHFTSDSFRDIPAGGADSLPNTLGA